MPLRAILLAIAAFLLGAVPFSYLIGRSRGVDLRKVGSGNIGATNLWRSCGRGAGSAGLVLDVLKGAIPVLLVRFFLGQGEVLVQSVVASAAILGHVFSPFLGLRGGKGAATALGALMALAPMPVLVALCIFLVVLLLFRIVSLASILAAAALVPAVFILRRGSGDLPVQVACCLVAAVVVLRHRRNIVRLYRGKETRITGGKDVG